MIVARFNLKVAVSQADNDYNIFSIGNPNENSETTGQNSLDLVDKSYSNFVNFYTDPRYSMLGHRVLLNIQNENAKNKKSSLKNVLI